MENPYQSPSTEPPPFSVGRIPGLKNPRVFALASVCLYAISTLGQVMEHLRRTFAAGVALTDLHLHDTYYVVYDGPGPFEWLMLGAMLPSALFFLLWKHRAASNAWIMNASVMTITPAMSVGCYFIPFVNLVMPCQAMAGIARASYGSTTGVAAWWATQIISMIAGLGIGIMSWAQGPAAPPSLAEHLYLGWALLTFVFAWRIVMKITRAQSEKCGT